MSTAPAPTHMHSAAVAALLAHDPQGRTKSQVAADASMTPANLRELVTSVRSGARGPTRDRVAAALGVPVAAISCWCDRPGGLCRSVLKEDRQ